jgi:predicted DNA-binding antitoxin AbrB/MazE fold protein
VVSAIALNALVGYSADRLCYNEVMGQKIKAIYEKGVLRPLSSLSLRERAQVDLEIEPDEEPVVHDSPDRIRGILVRAGLSLPEPDPIDDELPLPSPQRREELALLFSHGRPLSELIIEDREGR